MKGMNTLQSDNTDFVALVDRAELELVVWAFEDQTYRDQALRYYDGAVAAVSWREQLTAISLLMKVLESQARDLSDVRAAKLRKSIEHYHQRLSTTVDLLSHGKPVAKKLHFVWVGGGIGAIQSDYVNVWEQMTRADGYSLNLWYDSDGLLAHQTNKIILESAKAQGAKVFSQSEMGKPAVLGNLYVERARALHLQMFQYIEKAIAQGTSADQARIDLLVSAYGQDESALKALKARNLESIEGIGAKGILLRDIRRELSHQPLFDIYERELSFRGNLAAASDITRLQALNLEAGTYLDADLLPSLHENIAGMDVANLSPGARIGVMQVLLDHNPQILPNRGTQYTNYRASVPEQFQAALIDYAKNASSVQDVFSSFESVIVTEDGIRVGNKNPPASTSLPFSGLSNAMLSSHAGSAAINAIFDKIRSNYVFLDRVWELARQSRVSLVDGDAYYSLILAQMEKTHGPLMQWDKELMARTQFMKAVLVYNADGIKFEAESAIVMSGPSAVSQGLNDFVKDKGIAGARRQISDRVDLRDGFNLATEEEPHHSWKDNAKNDLDWFEVETARINDGAYKNHYLGNMDELLGQSLTFKRGWPIIEGKPVLLTSVLQQLLDNLGEPFIRAMNDRLSGDVDLKELFTLDFAQRQQILAQPRSDLPPSVGAESLGNLNEALARIGAGKLPIDQLSPLHRVVLGGLFGAQQLDNQGFSDAWEAARSLAANTQDRGVAARYEQIESVLHERNPPGFSAGLNAPLSGVHAAQNSYVLKAQALAEPLSVRQWGEHIARIGPVANEEYRSLILQRGEPVRVRVFQAGAISAKQVPQDLLVHGEGDPGRRCYPLALLMATAIEKGRAAERTLIGKLATANLAPHDPQAHALLRVLDELRGVPMAQFGEKLGPANLAEVMQTLEARTTTGSVMFNTPSHSLLACKVLEAGSTSYLFYEPNFGLYGFQEVGQLQRGIEAALADKQLATLYGIENVATTQFELIALDGSRIAEKALPSQVTAGDLIRSELPADGLTVEPWQHHAALRARALSENARLGRGIAELEGMHWAQIIESTDRHLLATQPIDPDSVPLYETVRPTEDGRWTLSMINRKEPLKDVQVTVNDERFLEIRNWLRERFKTLGQLPPEATPHGPEAVNTLNAGFAIMALMEILHKREGNAPMTLAVRLHGYVIYSQLAHGVGTDIKAVVELVRLALLDERLIAQTTSSVLGRTLGRIAGEGVGSLLALANVGFDIYELATADNAPTRTGAAVQLVFDLTALTLSGVAWFAGGTIAAVFGPFAMVVGALGFGIGAIARNYALNLLRAQQVGEYFYALKSAYRNGGYKVDKGMFSPMPDVVIKAIDLRGGQLTFGSQYLLGAVRPGLGLPDLVSDDSQAINMRDRWSLSERVSLIEPVHTLILPCTPTCYYGYDYQLMPGATHRHDQGFDEARELERDSQGHKTFWFDPWTPFEYFVYRLFPSYRATRVNIVLDEQCRSLHVPTLPIEWHGKLSYDIEAVTGQYSLSLAEGVVAVYLSSAQSPASLRWVIRAAWVKDTQVSIDVDGMKLGATDLRGAVGSEVYLELEEGQLFQVDWLNQRLTLLEQELPEKNDAALITEHLTRLNHAHRLASPWLPLHRFKVPFGDPQWPVHTNAWFEAVADRILYARDLPDRFNAKIQLGAVFADQVFFYHADQPTLWRADAVTGRINRRYRLFNPRKTSQLLSCQQMGEALRVVQRVIDQDDIVYQFEYLIAMEHVELVAVSSTLQKGLPFDARNFHWQGWNAFLENFDIGETDDDASVTMGGDIKSSTAAKFVSLQIHTEGKTFNAWIRRRDDWFVTGDELGLEHPLLMASQRDEDGSSMVFYDAGQKRLCAWQRKEDGPGGELRELLNDVDSVVSVADGHLAQTAQGLVFELHNDTLTLRGVNEHWLGVQTDWVQALPSVAKQHRASEFDVIGLSDASGAPLSARYLQGLILLVGSGQGRSLHYVGKTPHKTHAWIFASDNGGVWRQPLLTLERMSALFGTTTRLSGLAAPAALQQVWKEWSFAEVSPLGSGLQGRTHDGVILELDDGQPARISAVTREFAYASPSTQTPQARIASLIENKPHVPFLRAGSEQGVFSWYDSIARLFYSANARSDGQWVTYLGTKIDDFLMYDAIDNLVFSNDRALFSHRSRVRRNAQVLIVESSERALALESILVEGVNSLVLGYGHAGMSFGISAADWRRLDCVVVDMPDMYHFDSSVASVLALEMSGLDNWQLTLVDEHLVLTDPDSGHSLILRNARALANTSGLLLELKVHLWGGYRYFSVLELFKGWTLASVDGSSCELSKAMDASNEV